MGETVVSYSRRDMGRSLESVIGVALLCACSSSTVENEEAHLGATTDPLMSTVTIDQCDNTTMDGTGRQRLATRELRRWRA